MCYVLLKRGSPSDSLYFFVLLWFRRDWLLRRPLVYAVVIDFATLVFHCVGSAVYKYITGNAYGEIDAVATLYCVFPLESSAMSNQKAVLCTASFVISEHCFVQARQCSEKLKPLFRVAFLLRIALVIPPGWSVSAPDAHRRHFFRLTLHSLMQFSILKFGAQILLIFSVTLPLILVTLLTKIAKLFWKNQWT